MARSVGFAAVVTYRPEEQYECSPYILHEFGLAVQARQPRLVLRDKRTPNYFEGRDTLEVEFDAMAPERSADELRMRLGQFHALTSSRSTGRRYRQSKVGIALADGADETTKDTSARRAAVEHFIVAGNDKVVDLSNVADDPWELAQSADSCDFVVVEVDDERTSQIADFLLGRGIPLIKLARRGKRSISPARLLGSAPLRYAEAADNLVTYWSEPDEFESRALERISRARLDRTEFLDFDAGYRYFRSLGRETRPVFISNAGSATDVAQDLCSALKLENIPFFHYRFQNAIGWGQRWTDQLGRMVAASKVFVPLIDGSYWAREYCREEYKAAQRLADAGQLVIVPALLDGHLAGPEVPYQGADLRGRPRQEQVSMIVSQLDDLLAKKSSVRSEALGPVQVGTISVDVAIITILEEEYKAVLRLLTRVRQVMGSAVLDNQHAWIVGEIEAPQLADPYTVALAMAPRPGTNAAVIVTKNTLQAFDPRCVLIVGVAGGLGDIDLGDVVVADRICAYEYGKIDHGFSPRDDLDAPTDAAIATAANTFAARHPNWFAELDHSGDLRHLTPKIVVGKVASGDKVVDNPTDRFFSSVMRSRLKLRAVEMEGAGVAAAIQDAREMQQAVSFGMIRGISDLPRAGGSQPGKKLGQSAQTEMRDSWKVRASTAAAAAAVQLIRWSWPRPPRATSRP